MRIFWVFMFTIIFSLWVLILPLRSAQYVYRIYKESRHPPPMIFQEVDPCEDRENFERLEEERIYKYLKLDAKC